MGPIGIATQVSLCIVLLAACATVPDVAVSNGDVAGQNPLPAIVGSRGPLSAAQSNAVIDHFDWASPGDAETLRRHLEIEAAAAEPPLVTGNRIQLLYDGPESFHAIFAAITGAHHTINIESFILEDVVDGSQSLGDLLVAKRLAGVAVNVIYDSFGASATPAAFFSRLRQAGVSLVAFNPLNPLVTRVVYAPDHRDHRKLLVVDGEVAILGGVNLSHDYQSRPGGRPQPPVHTAPGIAVAMPWRDTDLRIVGPAVGELQTLFLDHWQQQNGPALPRAGYFPPLRTAGSEVVRIIGSTPDNTIPQFYATLLLAIHAAQSSISITAAYFVPTPQEMDALAIAAQRGVRVRLLLADVSDSDRAIDIAHAHYDDLLAAGVVIHETHGLVLHAKTVVVDMVWSAIGSSNFDHRSVVFNDEVDAIVLGRATGTALERMFDHDQANATLIDRATWAQRPLGQRLRETVSRLWEQQF